MQYSLEWELMQYNLYLLYDTLLDRVHHPAPMCAAGSGALPGPHDFRLSSANDDDGGDCRSVLR